MGAKAKKALKKNLKKVSAQLTLSRRKNESSTDFLVFFKFSSFFPSFFRIYRTYACYLVNRYMGFINSRAHWIEPSAMAF